METTLIKIVEHGPCDKGMAKLMNNLGYNCTEDDWESVYDRISIDDKIKPIDFEFIRESNGIDDTFWALRTQARKTRMIIAADIVESVLHIYENDYPNDFRIRNCIYGVRDYVKGKIKKEELENLKRIVQVASNEAKTTYIFGAACVAQAAYFTAEFNSDIIDSTIYYVIRAVFTTGDLGDSSKIQWEKNKQILLKYIYSKEKPI